MDDGEENLTAAHVRHERIKDKYEKTAKKLLGIKAGVKHLAEKVDSVRDDDDNQILITDDTVVEALYQFESLLVRLQKEINRTKSSSPDPSHELTVAENLTVMGITDREIAEVRKFNQRVALPGGNSKGIDMGDDLDEIIEDDKEDGEQLTRDKIKKAAFATVQHDKQKKRKSQMKRGKRKSTIKK